MLPMLKPIELHCEHKTNPVGIDEHHPRFSWITNCSIPNTSQSAYRILIASSMENLSTGSGDIWDSGKVVSSESVLINYDGTPLRSNTTYFWQVMIWIGDEPSLWSDPARFSTGLFAQEEWQAKWISHHYHAPSHPISFMKGTDKWIWYPYENPNDRFKNVYLTKTFEISGPVESALLLVTADEKFKLSLNGELLAQSDDKIFSWSRPVLSDVFTQLRSGENVLRAEVSNSYVESPGFLLRLEIRYESGELSIINSGEDWLASTEKNTDKHKPARIVASAGDKPWRIPEAGLTFSPAAYFRKEFNVQDNIKRAFVYCAALGLFHLRINDKPLTESKLSPLWSDFNNRIYYKTYDVTDLISSSEVNIIDAVVADGYYSGYCGWEKGRGYYGEYPALKLQLIIKYQDGTDELIITDNSWSSSEGPIREADILMGETYDSNYEELFVTAPVRILPDHVNPEMISYKTHDIKSFSELNPVSIHRIKESKHIVDFGQNFAGYVRLKLNNIKSKIVLRFAEVLNKDGSLYLDNIRMARAQDTYISKGSEEEIWEPKFTYHGFRYAEVTGLNNIKSDTVTGVAINSLPVQTSSFTCSNEKLNKLYECILWNQRSNYIDIPTDCPQRDERFGWTGDAVSYFRTSAFNHDVRAFYTKWFMDVFDAQKADGALPPFAPQPEMGVGPVFYNAAGWADAGIITPWQFYKFYNDKELLIKYYERMKLFLESYVRESTEYILPEYGYGDWLCIGKETSKSLIATAYFAYDCIQMKKIAFTINRKDDVKYYDDLFNKVRESFRKTFLYNDGKLKEETQTASVLTIYFDLLEEHEKEQAAEFLSQDIIKNNYHLTTGFLGLSFIMPVLSSLHRNDIAWKVLTNNQFPSWFFMINNGATTLWERWDSYHPDKGFFDPTMNSFNHCSLGCVGEWLFSGLAGISPLEPGFKKILFNPYIPKDLSFIQASFKSVNGTIESEWRKEGNEVKLNIKVPFNTSAEVKIPGKEHRLKVSSGSHEFQWKQL